jgi:hypothetical protein
MSVEACPESDIVPGDVIVFTSRKSSQQRVVHRVVAVMPGRGVRTRGDNNSHPDSQPVSYEDILGRVVSVRRAGRQRCLAGGSKDLRRARSRWALRRLEAMAIGILRPVYHRVCWSGLWKRWTHTRLKTRVVAFKRPTGVEYHLFVGRRYAGKKAPNSSLWQIKRLFRPFIDETSLPG